MLQVLYTGWTLRNDPVRRFEGDSNEICSQILESLWNGTYYQTGLSNFSYFWIRDFASVVPSLLTIGHADRVAHTLRFALDAYRKEGRGITTCIDKNGEPFDMPLQAIDSLPWLLYAFHKSSFSLTKEDKEYLQTAAQHYEETYIDPATGRVRENIQYAELRDVVRYRKSAYAMAMLALYARLAPEFGIETSIKEEPFIEKLETHYWNGKFLSADEGEVCISSECALVPFFLGVLKDSGMISDTISEIEERSLSKPYPMSYTDTPECFKYRWWHIFVPRYGAGTIWPWHGAIYLSLLEKIGHSAYKENYHNYKEILLRHGTLPELLHPDGKWYRSFWYRAEHGMIWAALFLALPRPSQD